VLGAGGIGGGAVGRGKNYLMILLVFTFLLLGLIEGCYLATRAIQCSMFLVDWCRRVSCGVVKRIDCLRQCRLD
jgi:hypothetical protein